MSETCGYCGESKEEHENGHYSTTARNVSIQAGAVSALESKVTFIGDCWDEAKENRDWDV